MSDAIKEVARLNAVYDLDLVWDGGCNGTDMLPIEANAFAGENLTPYIDGERFSIVVAANSTDIYVYVDPSEKNGYDFNVTRSNGALYYNDKSDGKWYRVQNDTTFGSLRKAGELDYLLFQHSIGLWNQSFRECLEDSNKKAFQDPAVAAFFRSFDLHIGAMNDYVEKKVRQDKARPVMTLPRR